MNQPSPFKTLASKIVYRNIWMQVREDSIIRPDGSEGIYSVLESNDSVLIIAANDNQEICFINIFRYPAQAWRWELPGGSSDGQDILLAAKRELQEETGLQAKDWQLLGRSRVGSGLLTEHQSCLLARGLTYDAQTDTEEGIKEHHFMPLQNIDRMIAAGEIDDQQSLSALHYYKNWLESVGRTVEQNQN